MLLTDTLLLNYRRCQRRTFLEIYGDRAQKEPEREFLQKLQRENQKQVEEVLAEQTSYRPHFSKGDWQAGAEQTLQLMQQGVDCIDRGVLVGQNLASFPAAEGITFLGRPTFLLKRPGLSKFGPWEYIPSNVKLGKRPKPEYKTIAAFHACLLGELQGVVPATSQLILRGGKQYAVDLNSWLPRMQEVVSACVTMLLSQQEPEVFISRQRCSLCRWQSYCHAIAQSQEHLSLVPGITPRRYQQLQEFGINSLEKLAVSPTPEIQETLGDEIAWQLQQQARSLVEQRAILKPDFPLNLQLPTAEVELYFDIEAEPERNLDFLLGVLCVNRRTKQERFYAFLAEKPEDEGVIWEQFLALVGLHPNAPIFHFSAYEVETVKRLAKLYKTPKDRLRPVLSRFVDLHDWVTSSVTLPIESYSLKSLANWLGFEWRDREASGERTVCWYDRWLQEGDRALLDAIIRYNEDDCRATYCLKNWLASFLSS